MSESNENEVGGIRANILTSRWLEVILPSSETLVCSPLDALRKSNEIRYIAAASPLDGFAIMRFLQTLIYWKADAGGGVTRVRELLMKNEISAALIDGIGEDAHHFELFDDHKPFLQDSTVAEAPTKNHKSIGSLFAEFATGTNIAHFHHGSDEDMRLCWSCAAMGLLRLVPWSQAGGQGITPSIHNAPPIMLVAEGPTLAVTLGLNLVPLGGSPGSMKWSGQFIPTRVKEPINYLEALGWNPRRVHLRGPKPCGQCWRCGIVAPILFGPIAYLKNEETKRESQELFKWSDPAAFYGAGSPYRTMKSYDEAKAMRGLDLEFLLGQPPIPAASVFDANPEHGRWHMVVPCTDPKNNKTFDHRRVEIKDLSAAEVGLKVSKEEPDGKFRGKDGWNLETASPPAIGCSRFVFSATRLLNHTDWTALSNAAYKEMHESPAAFDVLSGLLWSLRGRVAGLPSREAAWLQLKLMAAVPAFARTLPTTNAICPLDFLPKRQSVGPKPGKGRPGGYPVTFPRGRRLEGALRSALDEILRQRIPKQIDWSGLCVGLDRYLLDR